jgi:hypothetical protein
LQLLAGGAQITEGKQSVLVNVEGLKRLITYDKHMHTDTHIQYKTY